jgi:hypothetical protein
MGKGKGEEERERRRWEGRKAKEKVGRKKG